MTRIAADVCHENSDVFESEFCEFRILVADDVVVDVTVNSAEGGVCHQTICYGE